MHTLMQPWTNFSFDSPVLAREWQHLPSHSCLASTSSSFQPIHCFFSRSISTPSSCLLGAEANNQLINLSRKRRLLYQAVPARGYHRHQGQPLGRSDLQRSQAYVLRRADHRAMPLSSNGCINETTMMPSRQTAIETSVNSRLSTIKIGPKTTRILGKQNLSTIPLDSRSSLLVVTTMKTLTLTTSLWLAGVRRPVAPRIPQDASRRSRHQQTFLLDHRPLHPMLIFQQTRLKSPMQSRGRLLHRRAYALAMARGPAQNTVRILGLVKAVKALRARSVSVQICPKLTTAS